MKPIVLDCSITLSWCFSDEASSFSDDVLSYVQKNSALVPQIWTLELTNGLLSAVRSKRLTLDAALQFLEKFARLPIRVVPISTTEHFSKIFRLAHIHSLSSYDAAYLYLAIREKCTLATLDKTLAKAAKSEKREFI